MFEEYGHAQTMVIGMCENRMWDRSAMGAASQQPGGEHTDVDDAPAHAHYI